MESEPMRDEQHRQLREYLSWVDALLRSMETCLRGEEPSNIWKHAGYWQFARKYNQIVTEISRSVELPPILDTYDLDKLPGLGNTLAVQQKDYFESVHLNASILKAYLESRLGVIRGQIEAIADFIQAKLRCALLRPPDNERDVQDSLEQILIGRGLLKGQDYDRETGRVKVSGKESVPDFIMPKLDLAIEVKLVKDAPRVRAVVDEINADIMVYTKRYKTVLFVIYDMGIIRDELEFRHGLESEGNVSAIVIKH